MASLGDAYTIFYGQSSTPMVSGTKLNLKKGMEPILQRLIDMKKAGIVDVMDENSASLGASYADNTHIFYPCASWSPVYTIEANDKNGTGRWGVFVPPGGPFPMGGTVQGVPLKAKNKAGAAALIKFIFLTKEGSGYCRDLKGNFSPLKSVYDDSTFYVSAKPDPYFAGQDTLQFFSQQVFPKINSKNVRVPTKYDGDITDAANVAIKTINASANGNVNADDLIKSMQSDLISQHPELSAG